MKAVFAAALALSIIIAAPAYPQAAGGGIAVIAAENFYGDVARQIGGDRVSVTSVLSSPDQDPHLFEVTPAIVRQIASAKVVIYNGAAYDPWMEKLLHVTPEPDRTVIVAADLVHTRPGANPHIWYDPATMPAVAEQLAAAFSAADPAHKDGYAARLKGFMASLRPLDDKIAAVRDKYAGAPVTATEPVFDDMAAALGLKMANGSFQLAVMNDTEPSARDFAAFENDLQLRKVRLLFYNNQASNKMVKHLVDLAGSAKIPVVGVTETEPPGVTYQDWMLNALDATEKALAGPTS